MAVLTDVDLRIYDPSQQGFDEIDSGAVSNTAILLNILIELRVHTQYLQTMNIGIINDDPAQMRIDMVNDPSSLNSFYDTSNF